MAQQQAGKGKGGGTHSRTPRKRTRTTLEAGGMHSRTTADYAGYLAKLRQLNRKQYRARGLPTQGERPECLSHWPPCTWVDGAWVSADELKAYLRRLHRACRRIR